MIVIKAQRYVRDFLAIRKSRVAVIAKYWDSIEAVWWAQRQKKAKGNSESADERKLKERLKKKKGKREDIDKTSLISE